ncbi:MAG: hypothetical protein CVV23_11330 [Ignavibacteriae bacterium HGW-Ignavibacteriae-2]|jgi:hypothetical protein|nr:DUF2752 domain-containing protein [Bacteroidota bacterium]PKL88212.1 MAG: hypothetical protein CVV23_11330 [Ignavibacteriae bacterium HGW-Ignavibacteriae-2]
MGRLKIKSLKYAKKVLLKNSEAIIWIFGLSYLALINPYSPKQLTVCPLDLAGFEHCPGCGLGRSISFIFHGDVTNSIASHPLGILALVLLSYRIVTLIIKNYKASKTLPEVNYG